MSRQFYASDFRVLVSAAYVRGHDGEPCRVDDKDGVLFCTDDHGDVFYYVGPGGDISIKFLLNYGTKRKQLFRDYWKYADCNIKDPTEGSKAAPYFASILTGEYRRVKR